METKKPNIFDRKCLQPLPSDKFLYDIFSIRQEWELLIDPLEYSISYETEEGVRFYSPNLHLRKLYISKHDYSAIAEFFMMFQDKIHGNINGFPGISGIKFIVGEF